MTVFACDITSLNRAERKRHRALVQKLVASRTDQHDVDDGLLLTISAAMPPAEVAEWISFEVRCCPFISFTLELVPDRPSTVRLTGPEGLKRFVDTELGLS